MTDNHPWAYLTTRYGDEISRPIEANLVAALDELYHEDVEGLVEEDYKEHPNAWVSYGYDAGPVYVLDIYRGGSAYFSKYREQDDAEPEESLFLAQLSQEKALSLWRLLLKGEIEEIKKDEWSVRT